MLTCTVVHERHFPEESVVVVDVHQRSKVFGKSRIWLSVKAYRALKCNELGYHAFIEEPWSQKQGVCSVSQELPMLLFFMTSCLQVSNGCGHILGVQYQTTVFVPDVKLIVIFGANLNMAAVRATLLDRDRAGYRESFKL